MDHFLLLLIVPALETIFWWLDIICLEKKIASKNLHRKTYLFSLDIIHRKTFREFQYLREIFFRWRSIHQNSLDIRQATNDFPCYFSRMLIKSAIKHLLLLFITFASFHSWHKYKSLWMYDKNVVCDKYLNRGIPLVRLDEKFIFFTQIINDLENVKPYYDIKSIRINLRPLIQAIIEHAVDWRNTLGNMLSDRTSVEMVTMNSEFKVKFVFFPVILTINGMSAFHHKHFERD